MTDARPAPELSLFRLYVLRAMYLLIAFAQGSQTWPAIIHHTKPWDMWHGVGMSFLGALTALSLLGVRYPVRMLPLLIFELAWKMLWVLAAWLPLWLAHHVDADTADSFFPIIVGVVLVPLVLPWGYIWKNYVTAPGNRWK
ncbi:MAG TPA: hypothetical protein VFO25_06610 [Candidatus Eremiobacteraceae bacterium]|nr:hypothetical protein [Candidatus Eremiobacteraceae bacterium]